MLKPKLLIMAAGLGSRYGSLKQMESMTEENEIILDFSCYDAIKAGFNDIIFVIKEDMEEAFKEKVIRNIKPYANVNYVFQNIDDIPDEFKGIKRTKPWGTCHAVLAARKYLDSPFLVINSDDYYGLAPFKKMYDFLNSNEEENTYAMAGYMIENTMSDTGKVNRGICSVDCESYLKEISEVKGIEWKNANKTVIEANGNMIPFGTVVSMNFFGFKPSFLNFLEEDFVKFLKKADLSKDEFLLPNEVGILLKEEKARVKVLNSNSTWYGVTYKEDKKTVQDAFKKLKENGTYPKKLW